MMLWLALAYHFRQQEYLLYHCLLLMHQLIIAIQAQGEYLLKNDYLPFWNIYHAQLAVGYYNKFSNNTVVENYYGGEIGNIGTSKTVGDLIGNYAIGFTQINYGKIGLKAHGEVGGGLKIGYQYGEFSDVNYYADQKQKYGYKETLYYHGLVLEPTIFYRFGWEHFRIGLQLSGCYAPSFVKYKLLYNPITGGISFTYRF
ncbi:MAG: hypothetical protein PHH23_05090 [Paludibacteraceae bacterium]|nr:hypothetical protein [Paludibacteraceae bacterium]